MGDGYQVDVSALAQAGQRVADMAGQASSLRGAAQSAQVPEQAWGLLGELTTRSKYTQLQSQLMDHMSQVGSGVQGTGGTLTAVAQNYEQSETDVCQSFGAINPDADAAATTPSSSDGGDPGGAGGDYSGPSDPGMTLPSGVSGGDSGGADSGSDSGGDSGGDSGDSDGSGPLGDFAEKLKDKILGSDKDKGKGGGSDGGGDGGGDSGEPSRPSIIHENSDGSGSFSGTLPTGDDDHHRPPEESSSGSHHHHHR